MAEEPSKEYYQKHSQKIECPCGGSYNQSTCATHKACPFHWHSCWTDQSKKVTTTMQATRPPVSSSLDPADWAPEWVEDESVEKCQVALCSSAFTLTNRRHHCRRCGMCVCNACSQNKVEDSRVCNLCHSEYWHIPDTLPGRSFEPNGSDIVLVTGATGLVGSAIVVKLLKAERQVKILVRDPNHIPKAVSGAEVVKGDVTDINSLRKALVGVGIVYHCAGLPEQWLAPTEADKFKKVNYYGTVNIVQACQEAKIRKFIYTSTMDVFEYEAGKPFDESKISKSPKLTPYQISKQLADLYVTKKIYEEGFPAVILHPSAVYGPPVCTGSLNSFLVQFAKNEVPLSLPGGVSVVYSYDCADAHILAEKASIGARYLVCEKYQTINEIAQEVSKQAGSDVPTELPVMVAKGVSFVTESFANYVTGEKPLLPSGALTNVIEGGKPTSSKLREDLGWTPITFEKGIKKTIKFLKAEQLI